MKMRYVLETLNRELERRTKEGKRFYQKYQDLEDENKRLKNENELLRQDLFSLSFNHFKNKENGKEENNNEDCK